MIIVKPIVSFILLIPYICLLGMFTFEVSFPDGDEITYTGWIV